MAEANAGHVIVYSKLEVTASYSVTFDACVYASPFDHANAVTPMFEKPSSFLKSAD